MSRLATLVGLLTQAAGGISFMEWVYVACGGALGAISRHAVNLAVMNLMGSTLVGTFIANITGSFLLGLLIAFWEPRGDLPTEHRLFLAVGFLGSYTTFSTLAVATTQSFESGDIGRAALNLGGSIAVGLAAAFAGLAIGRAIA